MLRTQDEIKAYLDSMREKILKAKERKAKAIERKKAEKELDDLRKKRRQEKRQFILDRTETRTNPFTEAFFMEDALYETREEIMEAEERGEGRINWPFFDCLVDKVKKELKCGKRYIPTRKGFLRPDTHQHKRQQWRQ